MNSNNSNNNRMNGVIVHVIHTKGFGFLRGNDRISRFFHANDVSPRIDFDLMREGQTVTFVSIDMGSDNPAMKKGNGLRAIEVQVVE